MHIYQQLLQSSAHIHVEEWRLSKIAELTKQVRDWDEVIRHAEPEGVAPMLLRHIAATEVSIPDRARNELRGLAIRHRHASRLRAKVFSEVVVGLEQSGINCLGLKGIALCSLIYPEIGLRPMRDIDLLIERKHVSRTQTLLEDFGFRFERQHASRYMKNHHHLPNATLHRDGLLISLEVHTQAISGDAPGNLDMLSLQDIPRSVETEFGTIHTLGHLDMLNQLVRHALEPGQNIRLLSVMDILGYASIFESEIDWARLESKFPYLPIAIGLMDYITELPENLSRFKPDENAKIPDRVGKLIPTPGSLSNTKGGALNCFLQLNNPPDWWMRCYYGVAAHHSVNLIARSRHLLRTSAWMLRRLKSAIR